MHNFSDTPVVFLPTQLHLVTVEPEKEEIHVQFLIAKSYIKVYRHLGPVVQSIVSLTSSLRRQLVKCFMTL